MTSFNNRHCRAKRRVGNLCESKETFHLLFFDLSSDVLWERRRINWPRSLAFPCFDFGFRFWQGSNDLSFPGSAFFQGQVSACESTAALVKGVLTDVGNTGILAGKLHARFGTILTPFRFARKTAMQAFEAFEFGAQGFGILHHPAIAALGKPTHAHIYSDWLGRASRRVRNVFVHPLRDKPSSSL